MSDLAGKYFSKTFTTSGADEDIISTLRTASGDPKMTNIKKLTLITTATITIKINGQVNWSDLYSDLDDIAHLSLDASDVLVTSLVVHENASPLFVAIVY